MPKDFLSEEIRCGHLVSSKMKAVWKVELDILESFIGICQKYNLKYFMIAGSLLGAVRHKGFIPWDDDIDVAMPRPDFDRFVQVASKELAYPMHFMNVVTDPERNTDYAQIRNSETTMLSHFWVDKRSIFNHGIMLDVFCLDGVYANEFVRRMQNLCMRIMRSVNWCAFYHGKGWRLFLKPFAWLLYKVVGAQTLYRVRRAVLNLCPFEKSSECGLIGFLFDAKRFQWTKTWFDDSVEMPFEYLTVQVPVEYDKILTKTYGDWHKFVQGGAMHESLCIDPYRSYKDVLVEQFGYDAAKLDRSS